MPRVVKKTIRRSGQWFLVKAAMEPRMTPQIRAMTMAEIPSFADTAKRELMSGAPVAVQNILHIEEVLNPDRFVQIVPGVQFVQNGLGNGLLLVEGTAGNQIHDEECDETYDEDCKNCEKNPLDDVFGHDATLLTHIIWKKRFNAFI